MRAVGVAPAIHLLWTLWDGSDPTYAPGRVKIRNGYKWQCPKRYKEAGYTISYISLEGDLNDQALKCRELTREVLNWYDNRLGDQIDTRKWKYLLARYKGDKHSALHEKAPATKLGYIWWVTYWENLIGEVKLSNTNYEKIKFWEAGMKRADRNIAFISAAFKHLRIVVNYCKANEIEQAIRISAILSEMRFKTPKRREIHMNRKQVYKVIDTAMNNKHFSKALGYVIQFEIGLSATDVIGQWVEPGELSADGGIKGKDGKYWTNGLTWGSISSDLSSITKGRNKTGTRAIEYDISKIEPLQKLLKSISVEKRVGPLIISENTGLPYKSMSWTKGFTKMMKLAGLEGFQCRDLRASGITAV